MAKPPTAEERLGILETGKSDCQKTQDERHKDVMKRVERLENKFVGALGVGVVITLGMIVNIIVTLLKK